MQSFPLRPIVFLGNFRSAHRYIPAFSHDRDEESPANRARNKERAERREKRPGEHERNTRRRVRKSECHCRNLRTLTSSWLVPPSSSWSQPLCSPPPPTNIHPSSSSPFSLFVLRLALFLSLSLSLTCASRFASSPLSIFSSLPPSAAGTVFPPREFQVFCDNSRS